MFGMATKLGIVHVCDTSPQKAKWGVLQVQDQFGLLSQKEKNNKSFDLARCGYMGTHTLVKSNKQIL